VATKVRSTEVCVKYSQNTFPKPKKMFGETKPLNGVKVNFSWNISREVVLRSKFIDEVDIVEDEEQQLQKFKQ
jgi:hypothetical protein